VQATLVDLLASGAIRATNSITSNDELQSNFGVLLLWDLFSRFASARAVAGDPNVLLEPGQQGSIALRTDVPSLYLKTADTPNNTWVQFANSGGATGTVNTSAPITGDGSAGSPVTVQNNPHLPGVTTVDTLVSLGAAQAPQLIAGDSTPTDGVLAFVLGGAASASIRPFAGNPNGLVSALEGSLILDTTSAKLWINTSGAMVWTQLGGAGAFYDTTLTPAALAGPTDNWNPGALGQNTLVLYNGGANNLTGMVGGVDGKIVTLLATSGHAQASIQNEDAGSAAANRFLTSSGAPTSINVQGSHTWVYVGGAVNRWCVLGTGVS
jgi:hypothetical protein